MARGVVVVVNGVRQYEGNITNYVVVTCLVAAMGGLLFGYDSGGVITRGPVLKKFFPSAFEEEKDDHEMDHGGVYCKSDGHQLLTLFTSSLYIAALVSSFIASSVTRAYGRNISMCLGAYIYFTGAVVSAAAIHTSTLIIGRILLGIGVGFTIQSILIYISEMAPPKFRGALNVAFQMAVTIGILVSNFVNYGTAQIKGGWGWRLSFALAVVPALMLAVGSIFLPDTPNSMLERDQPAGKAKKLLKKIRGTSNIELEFQDLAIASEAAKKAQHPWKTIWQRRYRPHLVMCILIPFFQQLTGINAIMFYAPVIFNTLGLGDKASLLCSAIIGAVNAVSTCVSIAFVDTCGRRPLFLEGGVQMCICQVAIGILIGSKFAVSSHGSFSESETDLLVIIVCCYVAAFAWSWGPLGWLVPSEICPLEIRSAGHALNVSVNMLFTFGITQTSLTMLCHFKCGLFFFFAGFIVIMTVFVYYFLPETMNVPIEDMNTVWKTHWFWGKYIPDDADDFVDQLHAGISRGGSTEGETLPSPRL